MKTAWGRVEVGRERLLAGFLPVLILVCVFTPWKPVQFLVLFFLFLLLFSRLWSEYLIRHLRLRRGDTELRGFRHEWIEVEYTVENHGRIPAFMLASEDSPGRLPVFRGNKDLRNLYGRRSRVIRWQGFGTSRGLFTLGPGVLRGADPLGIFPFSLTAVETTKLFVYPAPAWVQLKAPGGIPLGVLVSTNPFNEDLTRRRSVREYTAGDELRRINWKASARLPPGQGSAGLMVNEYEASLSYPLVVFMNAAPLEYPARNREFYLERVIEAAAALCIMASRDRQALGFILHTSPEESAEVISPSAFALIPILERLAVLERRPTAGEEAPKENNSVDRMLKLGKSLPFGTRLVYAGPSLEEGDYRALESLKRSRLTLEFLVIDETTLPGRPRQYQMKERGYEIV